MIGLLLPLLDKHLMLLPRLDTVDVALSILFEETSIEKPLKVLVQRRHLVLLLLHYLQLMLHL